MIWLLRKSDNRLTKEEAELEEQRKELRKEREAIMACLLEDTLKKVNDG